MAPTGTRLRLRRATLPLAGLAACVVASTVLPGRASADPGPAAPAAAASLAAPDPSACGPTLTKPDGTPWQCTFVDDFDGTTLDRSKWIPQETANSGFGEGGECFVDDPDNVAVAGGSLRLTVRKEKSQLTCKDPKGSYRTAYTAGSVSTYQRFSQAFGRFEVRAKMPNVKTRGLQEAIWLWPDNPLRYGPWPFSGEIDIAEVYHQYWDRAIPYLHYVPNPWWDPTVTNNYCLVKNVWDWHTYTLEWTADRIRILYDGQVCLDHKINPYPPLAAPQPFDQPFMVALTQALGTGTNAVTAATPLPATMEVDYVRVWA